MSRIKKIFIVTMVVAILAMSFTASASHVEGLETEHLIVAQSVVSTAVVTETSKPWYETAWNGVCDTVSFCGETIVDGACTVGSGVKYAAGSYLLWYADLSSNLAAWAQETGTELVG